VQTAISGIGSGSAERFAVRISSTGARSSKPGWLRYGSRISSPRDSNSNHSKIVLIAPPASGRGRLFELPVDAPAIARILMKFGQ
jgi:hypothetical protein